METSKKTEQDDELHAMFKGSKLTLSERISRAFVLHPIKLFSAVYVVLLALSGVVFLAGWFDIDETSVNDWTVPESKDSEYADALAQARELRDVANQDGDLGVRSASIDPAQIQIIFEWNDDREDDLFTAANVREMCKVTRVITGDEQFPRFCRPAPTADAPSGKPKGVDTACAYDFTDVVTLFYPTTEARKDCELLDQDVVDEARKQWFELTPVGTFFMPIDNEDGSEPVPQTRSLINMYGPLGADSDPEGKGFSELIGLPDPTDRQTVLYSDFLVDRVEANLNEYLGMEAKFFSSAYNTGGGVALGEDGLQMRWHCFYSRDQEFQRLVGSDQFLVSGAVMFVGVVVFLHTRSLFITINGVVSILVSIPVSLFVYTGIIGIEYFSDIHIVVIFLVLGIGANDVFVFFDAFRQSKTFWVSLRGVATPREALEHNYYGTGDADEEVLIARMSYTFLRATGAVFNTSFTTFAAFMATGVSPVAPVAAFGFFAAITILMNWVFTMILYPSFAIIYHRHFEGRPFCCACRRAPLAGAGGLVAVGSPDVESDDRSASSNKAEEHHMPAPPEETCEEKVFSRGYVPLMEAGVPLGKSAKLRPVPVFAIVGLLAAFGVMASYTFKLETPSQRDEPFGTQHMYFGFIDDLTNNFKGGNDFLSVDITFGIDSINRGNFSRFAPNGYRGKAVFDDAAQLTTSAAQEHILSVCDGLLDLSCIPEGGSEPFPGCNGEPKIVSRVDCSLRRFHQWYAAANFSDVEAGEGANAALLLGDADPELFTKRMDEWVRFAKGNDATDRADVLVGTIEGELKFFTITYTTNLKGFSPETVKAPIFEVLFDYLDEVRKDAPPEAASVFQTSFDMLWSNSEVGLVDGMFTGLAISLPIAYAVLLFATTNVVLSTYAIIAIVAIVCGVLGAAYLIGWSLGVGEAIASVMVIGLSVDFSTHTGSMYTHAGREGKYSRLERFRYSSLHMGPTVLAGAVTTGGSACVMFFCQLQFFTKMATLISLTMALSVAYTFFFFLALCLLAGPQGHFGDWAYYLSKLCGSSSRK